MVKWAVIHNVVCTLEADQITLHNSYKLEYSNLESLCENLRKASTFHYGRTNDSWKNAILAHKLLYSLKLFRSKTCDTVLRERESKFRLFGDQIFAGLYKAFGKKGSD